MDNKLSRDADVAVVACLSCHVNIAPSSPRPGLSHPPPIIVVVIVVACRLSLPPPQIPAARMPRLLAQGDSIPSTIAIPRHHCPRRMSRRASSTLIIVAVVIIDVGVTLPPSDGVHGICHGATAGRGASDDANFGHSGSLQCRRILCACHSVILLERQSPKRKRMTCN